MCLEDYIAEAMTTFMHTSLKFFSKIGLEIILSIFRQILLSSSFYNLTVQVFLDFRHNTHVPLCSSKEKCLTS